MNKVIKNRKTEHGGAGVKLAIILTVLFLLGNAAYNYIPVAYEGQSFKQDMQTAVVQGMATPVGVTPGDFLKGKLQRAMRDNNVPTDAVVEVKPINNVLQLHVRYSKQVNLLPFGMYKYTYNFDNTATPTGFLLKS